MCGVLGIKTMSETVYLSFDGVYDEQTSFEFMVARRERGKIGEREAFPTRKDALKRLINLAQEELAKEDSELSQKPDDFLFADDFDEWQKTDFYKAVMSLSDKEVIVQMAYQAGFGRASKELVEG